MTERTFNKYKLVVDEWFSNGFNGVKAWQKHYPNSSSKTADKRFRVMTEIDRVCDYIDQKQKDSQQVLRTSHEALLNELELWAYSDITETLLLTPEQLKELPINIRRLITKFKHTQRHLKDSEGKIYETINVIELQFVSKERAMEMIHKHTGFYGEHNFQKNTKLSKEERKKRIAELRDKMNN